MPYITQTSSSNAGSIIPPQKKSSSISKIASSQKQISQQATNSMDQRTYIPAEIAHMILSHLHPVEDHSTLHQVSQTNQLYNACSTPLLWRTITFNSYRNLHDFVNNQLTSKASKNIKYARTLRITGVRVSAVFDDNHMRTLSRCIPKLESIELKSTNKLTDLGLEYAIKKHGVNLKILRLDRCQLLSDASINMIAEHCPQLRVFSMSYNYNITDAAIVNLVSKCPLLTYVNLECTAKIGEDSVVALALQARHLRYLDLKLVSIGERALAALATGTHDIVEEDPNVDQNTTSNISRTTPRSTLEFIALSKCTTDFSTPSLIRALARHSKTLKSISIMLENQLTATNVREILAMCPLISDAKIHRCANIDEDIIKIATLEGWFPMADKDGNRLINVTEENHISMEELDVSRYV